MKGKVGSEQDFYGNFQVNVTLFFAFSLMSLTELISFRCGLTDFFTLHKLADKVILDH